MTTTMTATVAKTASNTSDDLVQLIASQATAQFVRGLLLGIVLTVGAALVAARMLLFHSPSSSSKHLLYRRRKRTPSTFGATTASAGTGPPNSQGPPLPLPLSTLILLHRQLLSLDPTSSSSATPPTSSSSNVPPPPGSPAALSAAAELSASYVEGESLAFVNFLLAEVISTYRSDQRFMDWLKVDVLEKAINKSLPAFVDRISVSDLSLGQHDQFPLFRRARLRPCRNDPPARSSSGRGPRAGSAHASAMNERWRIELDIEFENLSSVAKRASAVSQQQAREQQAAAAAGSTGSLSRSGSLRQRKISSSHNSRSGSPRPATIPLASATFGASPPSASTSSVNPSPLGGGSSAPASNDRPTLTSSSTSLQPPPTNSLNLGEDSLTSEPDYSPPSFLELGLDTQLVLNWPKPGLAALPVHLMLEVTHFRATLAIEFHPHTAAAAPDDVPMLTLSILPGYKFDFRVSSLLGSRTKLRDVPKIADLITMAVQSQLAGMVVDPAFVTVPLPGVPLTPRPAAAPAAATEPPGVAGPGTGNEKGGAADLGHQGDDEHESSGASSSEASSAGHDGDVESPVKHLHRRPSSNASVRQPRAAVAKPLKPAAPASASAASATARPRTPSVPRYPAHVPVAVAAPPMSRWPVPSDRDLLRSPTTSPFARASAASSGSTSSLHLAAAAAASLAASSSSTHALRATGAGPRLVRSSSVPPEVVEGGSHAAGYYARASQRGEVGGEEGALPPVPSVPRQFAKQQPHGPGGAGESTRRF